MTTYFEHVILGDTTTTVSSSTTTATTSSTSTITASSTTLATVQPSPRTARESCLFACRSDERCNFITLVSPKASAVHPGTGRDVMRADDRDNAYERCLMYDHCPAGRLMSGAITLNKVYLVFTNIEVGIKCGLHNRVSGRPVH